LTHLRPRTHAPLRWDERFAPFIARAGFLPLARMINAGLPDLDGPLMTAFVDRWRPETHSFHMACGEMTVTLQDVAYLFGLRLEGLPVTGTFIFHVFLYSCISVHVLCVCLISDIILFHVFVAGTIDTENWKDLVEQFTGYRPPDPEEGKKEHKTSGVSSKWLSSRFRWCPADAAADVVERHAKVWLWHMVATFLLPDASGNTVSWMVLPQLSQDWENIAGYSWGSATLAWLYRQLCEACRRAAATSNLGGCAYLLQLWIWERIPTGRVHRQKAAVSTFLYFAPCVP
jgi:hypothetical protein